MLCKGAPEVIQKYLKEIPNGYKEHYIDYVKNGARVLVADCGARAADQFLKMEEAVGIDASANLKFVNTDVTNVVNVTVALDTVEEEFGEQG